MGLLEWFKTILLCPAEGVEKLTFLIGVKNGTTTLENSFMVSYKDKHVYQWSSDSISGYLTKRNKNICPYKDMYSSGHRSFILKGQKKWKQLKCPSTGGWVNKLWDIYTAEQYSTTINNMDGSQMHYANRKRPDSKYSIYMTFLQRANP